MDIKQALAAPAKHFASPEDVADHDQLNLEQKCIALHQWAYDLHELQVATDENMSPEADRGQSGEQLRRIENLLTRLDPDGKFASPNG